MRRPALWVILGAALVVRGALLAAVWDRTGRCLTPDSREYEALARGLLQRGQFSRAPGAGAVRPRAHCRAELFRTPGYPLLLAATYGLGGSARAVLAVQALLDVGVCLLAYLLGRRLCCHRAGLLAAAFQAGSTVAVVASMRILSDGLFAFLLTADILLLTHYFKSRRPWALAAGALVAGAACYVRPVGLYFGALALVVLLCRRRPWRPALAFAGLFATCVAPWVLRNHSAAGHWGFSTLPARALFEYQGPYVIAKTAGVSVDEARARLRARLAEYASGGDRTRGELEAKKASLGLEVLRRHPGVFLAMHARGSLAVWAPGEGELLELLGERTGERGTLTVLARDGVRAAAKHYTGGLGRLGWVLVAAILVLAAKAVLVLTGAWGHLRRGMGASEWLLIATVAMLTLLPGVFGHPRFRVPATPLLNLAAAAGALALAQAVGRRRHARPTSTTD